MSARITICAFAALQPKRAARRVAAFGRTALGLSLGLCCVALGASDAFAQESEPAPGAQPEPAPDAQPAPEPAPPAEPEPPPPAEPPATQPPAVEPVTPATEPPPAAEPAESTAEPSASETSTSTTAVKPAQGQDQSVEVSQDAPDSSSLLGLSPGAPQISQLPGGITPAFGQSSGAQDWRFYFHGLLLTPLRVGIGERENALQGQKVTTLHGPPVVPGNNFESFDYTSVVLDPWVQLNFSYGNPVVTATVIVAARSIANAEGFFEPPTRVGINDAFLTFRIPVSNQVAFNLDVGGFSNRYGHLGEYDLGRYGTPVIFRVGGMGAVGRGDFTFNRDFQLITELGFAGQTSKAPVGVQPAGWNGFADPNVGSSFVGHGHAVLNMFRTAALGLHYGRSFVQDDRATPLPGNTDGSITVTGVDLRLTAGRFGHLYAGFAHTSADQARAVSSVLRVLNAPGGPGLINEYFGAESGGTGSLDTFGLQYDFSLGNYLRYPGHFAGDGPDVFLGVHGILTSVGSDDQSEDEDGEALYDGVTKLKYGGEVTYSFLKWLAGSFRYDRVSPNLDDNDQTHAILSPRLIFRSDWGSQDQVVLQYSRYLNGSRAAVFDGYPPVRDASVRPDEDVLMLSASMWW